MTDTRCTNPEYQLDVDLMILDYLLHHVLRSCFDHTTPAPSIDDEEQDGTTQASAATVSILRMFDSFLPLFRANHPKYQYTAGTRFNIGLLETVLLLRKPAHEENTLLTAESLLHPESPIDRYEEWHDQIRERQTWLKARLHSGNHRADKERLEKEDQVFAAWSDYQSASERNPAPERQPSPLFGVLHRFLALSATIAQVMGSVNEELMQLSCDAMLQAALQVLLTPGRASCPTDITTRSLRDHDLYVIPTIGHVFAYGYNPTKSDNGTSPSSNDIFSEAGRGANDNMPVIIENPKWTSMRHSTILEFQIPLRSLQDHSVYAARLARLRHKYPYAEFHAKMLGCLEHFWSLNQESDMGGKPVLVQIEEGSLQGLSKAEFAEFLVRCGIRRVDDGNLMLGLKLEQSLWAACSRRRRQHQA